MTTDKIRDKDKIPAAIIAPNEIIDSKIPENIGNKANKGGRPKGSLNKVTVALKEAILAAGEAAGGPGGMVAYLTGLALEQPVAFSGLLGRVLPLTIAGDGKNPLNIRVTRKLDISGLTAEQLDALEAALTKTVLMIEHDPNEFGADAEPWRRTEEP